jgi:hypothetical protein
MNRPLLLLIGEPLADEAPPAPPPPVVKDAPCVAEQAPADDAATTPARRRSEPQLVRTFMIVSLLVRERCRATISRAHRGGGVGGGHAAPRGRSPSRVVDTPARL